MEKGEVRQELSLDETRSGIEDLEEIARDTAGEVGLDFEKLVETGLIHTSVHPLTSEINPDVIAQNVLRIIWFKDTPVGISLETRNDFNKTAKQSVRFGLPDWRHPAT